MVAQTVRNLSALWETWVRSLGQEDPLEEGMATYSSILAWKIPWTEECGRLTVHGVTKSQTQLSDFTSLCLLSSLRENIFFVLCVLVLLANPLCGILLFLFLGYGRTRTVECRRPGKSTKEGKAQGKWDNSIPLFLFCPWNCSVKMAHDWL